VSLVRDEWRDVPTMLLTDREIVRDSTQVTFTMLGDEDPDAVIVEYVDENTWLPAQVQYPPNGNGFLSANAEVKRIDGIVNRSQAFRECAFYDLQSIYRRESVQVGTEYEGRAITFGAVLRIQSELPLVYGLWRRRRRRRRQRADAQSSADLGYRAILHPPAAAKRNILRAGRGHAGRQPWRVLHFTAQGRALGSGKRYSSLRNNCLCGFQICKPWRSTT
jgi:hypothetical protein